MAKAGFEPETSLPHNLRCLHKERDGVTLFSEGKKKTLVSTNLRALSEPAPHNKQKRTQATGGQAARVKAALSAELVSWDDISLNLCKRPLHLTSHTIQGPGG